MRIEGKRVSGTMKIARALETLVPAPPPMRTRRWSATRRGPTTRLQDTVRRLAR